MSKNSIITPCKECRFCSFVVATQTRICTNKKYIEPVYDYYSGECIYPNVSIDVIRQSEKLCGKSAKGFVKLAPV